MKVSLKPDEQLSEYVMIILRSLAGGDYQSTFDSVQQMQDDVIRYFKGLIIYFMMADGEVHETEKEWPSVKFAGWIAAGI